MAEEPISTLTTNYVSAANRRSIKPTKATSTASAHHSRLMTGLGHLLTGGVVIGAALLTASGVGLVHLLENQAICSFFLLRGPVAPPEEIVILAIDNQSISLPEQYYKANPQQYAYLESLKSFPFKRAAYAQVIEKLMQAGARSVALDVVFDSESSYGTADDRQLQRTLQQYGSKVTLAAVYEDSLTHQGIFTQLKQPQPMFRTESVSIGTVNFPLEVDGKIHRLAREYNKLLAQNDTFIDKIPAFEEAVLNGAQIKYPRPKGDRIYFFGPAQTFKIIPLWYVLDPPNWNNYLQQGKVFQDKIVLIGATAKLGNDYYAVATVNDWLYPEPMSGVEIHANAIATLMTGKTLGQGITSLPWRGLFVLVLVGGKVLILTRTKSGISRLISSIALASIWAGISYILFLSAELIFPTTVPIAAIILGGFAYLGTDFAKESIKKRQLVDIFQKYKSSPIVQEIISQQHDLHNLLQQRDLAVAGNILSGRYKILQVLGSGGFSETYIAEDTQRPGNPLCVVKQLKPANTKSRDLELARRLFNSEAQTLEKLGIYHQIPQLLAYFEEDTEFYLIQEYIVGHPLSQELPSGKTLDETSVIEILRDLLQTLAFVHQNGVIHRDIKPSNIIRRQSDSKLVLIDFGAVKEVTTPQIENSEDTPFTIGIGTKGYAPNEQCFGRPQYNSDIYALGMIAIKALTGISPHEFNGDANEELKWRNQALVSHPLAEIISKMVRENYKRRYQSVSEVIDALDELVSFQHRKALLKTDSPINTLSLNDSDTPTTPWEKAS
ncbi:MAG: CHASE2 domain-containing protein [Gloeotrichia echinulata DVL01]